MVNKLLDSEDSSTDNNIQQSREAGIVVFYNRILQLATIHKETCEAYRFRGYNMADHGWWGGVIDLDKVARLGWRIQTCDACLANNVKRTIYY